MRPFKFSTAWLLAFMAIAIAGALVLGWIHPGDAFNGTAGVVTASFLYGCVKPGARGRTYPVAASQYFHFNGGAFVYLDASGHVLLALTATTTLFGYAIASQSNVGAGAAGSSYWKSSATAGADKIFVYTDFDAEFLVPADASPADSDAGNACDLLGVNDGTVQQADIGTSTTDVLIIVKKGPDVNASAPAASVVVRINPAKRQSDT